MNIWKKHGKSKSCGMVDAASAISIEPAGELSFLNVL